MKDKELDRQKKNEYLKEWRKKNLDKTDQYKERSREYQKKWRTNNPDKAKASKIKWEEANPGRGKELQREWRKKNAEYVKEKSRKYREDNYDKITDRYSKWLEVNKERYKKLQREYQKKRKQEDPAFKFMSKLRIRHSNLIRGVTSTTDGLGCTPEEFVEHLKSQFQEGMTMENYGNKKGQWSIDHKMPLSEHDKDITGGWDVDSDYNKALIHYTNLRPMWHTDNVKKRDIVSEEIFEEFMFKNLGDNIPELDPKDAWKIYQEIKGEDQEKE